ncbi:MAG: DUF5715 family protein [Vicinamibacterales bacterium]
MTRAHVLLLRVVCITVVAHPGAAPAQSLRGSPASLEQQNRQARRHDFTYLRESAQVHRFVDAGLLVRVLNREDYVLKDVSFPFARPEVKLFVERLSGQYRRACGEPLVVTSLTRPKSHQPRNASPDSVHPTGMALDLRRPRNSACRRWLEDTLLYLEARMILDATLERGPPHYHVAVFPRDYAAYVAGRTGQPASEAPTATAESVTYQVRRRDTLWRISRRYGTTPSALRRVNRLESSLIHPGQILTIPPSTD